MKVDDKRLAEIDARVRAATRGPWVGDTGRHPPHPLVVRATTPVNAATDIVATVTRYPADREFMAHARTDVPDLVADLREARADADLHLQIACGVAFDFGREQARLNRHLSSMIVHLQEQANEHSEFERKMGEAGGPAALLTDFVWACVFATAHAHDMVAAWYGYDAATVRLRSCTEQEEAVFRRASDWYRQCEAMTEKAEVKEPVVAVAKAEIANLKTEAADWRKWAEEAEVKRTRQAEEWRAAMAHAQRYDQADALRLKLAEVVEALAGFGPSQFDDPPRSIAECVTRAIALSREAVGEMREVLRGVPAPNVRLTPQDVHDLVGFMGVGVVLPETPSRARRQELIEKLKALAGPGALEEG